jgi:hypothetical protein
VYQDDRERVDFTDADQSADKPVSLDRSNSRTAPYRRGHHL